MIIIFIRTIILYLLIIVSVRIMGKRQIGELQPSELVITILISNIATLPIEDTDIPLIGGIIPILTLVSLEVIMSTMTLKNFKLRKVVAGSPIVVVKNGQINQEAMQNIRFSIDDLMEELRSKDIFDIREVEFAVVETNGKVSVYQKFKSRTVTADMLGIMPEQSTISPPLVIISDGKIVSESLSICELSESWINQILQSNNQTMDSVFLMTANRSGDYHLVPKSDKLKKNNR